MIEFIVDGTKYRSFDHLYSVSRCGKFLRNLVPHNPVLRNDGYLSLGRRRLAHRVVATCWVDNPGNAKHVHHKNENKSDNRASNLEWISPKRHMSEKHKDIYKNKHMGESTKQKIREARLGSRLSSETKRKIGDSIKRLGIKPPPMAIGSKHKPETLKKMSDNHGKAKTCIVFGITYPSFKKAGDDIGVRPLTVRLRCLSKNFDDYQLG